MPRFAVLAACVTLLACDSDRPTKPLESPPKEKPATVAKQAAPAKSEAKAEPTKTAAKDILTELTAKPHPSLVGPFAALALDPKLTVGAARRTAPQLFTSMRKGALTGPYVHTSPEFPGVDFEIELLGQIDSELDAWLVESLRISLPKAGVLDRLMTAWGEPTTRNGSHTWLAPDLHLRADLPERTDGDRTTLTLQIYTPLADFIGSDPKLFGFEAGAPILGATGAELLRRFGRRIVDYNTVVLPPLEQGPELRLSFADPLELGEDDLPEHVVTGWAVDVYDDRMHAALEKKLGKPTPDPEHDVVKIYAKKPRITFDGDTLVVGEAPGYD
jgi:hypothetical protein